MDLYTIVSSSPYDRTAERMLYPSPAGTRRAFLGGLRRERQSSEPIAPVTESRSSANPALFSRLYRIVTEATMPQGQHMTGSLP